MSLLKVKWGGNERLVKYSPSKVIYRLNIDEFDLTTLMDNGVVWQQSNNPRIYKADNKLVVQFKSGGSVNILRLNLTQFNIDSDYSVKLKTSIDFASSGSGITPEWGAYPALSDYSFMNLRGQRVGNYTIENLNPSYYTQTVYNMKSILNRSKTNPWETCWEYRKSGNLFDVSLKWDDEFICDIRNYDLTNKAQIIFTNNVNGSSADQKIYIEELLIEKL